ncbi:MAG: hypothetical protein DHS20C18_39430 [Saprospiraceae bacterium]|nr:MAG: hypothetical protein DHS20C18_39430 [Saprospiraceae bacterium]
MFFTLALTTVFDVALMAYRLFKMGAFHHGMPNLENLYLFRGHSFLFLAWNLLLAWIPYLLAILLERKAQQGIRLLWLLPILFGWLLFFPNAPYIVTDLLHLQHRPPLPLWYDLLLLFSCAWTGLMLGFLSMLKVHQVLDTRLGPGLSWAVVVASISLTGFGVYLGRFLRWNSWDLFTQPLAIIRDILMVISQPLAHLQTFGLAIVLTAMLLLGYFTLIVISHSTRWKE